MMLRLSSTFEMVALCLGCVNLAVVACIKYSPGYGHSGWSMHLSSVAISVLMGCALWITIGCSTPSICVFKVPV